MRRSWSATALRASSSAARTCAFRCRSTSLERLQGRKVDALDRRAKYLLARLDDGEVLVMHLGMTGRFSIDQANGKTLELGEFEDEQKPAPKHEHIVFHLADGTAVRYSDTRRFGLMDLIPGKTLPAHALFKGLGVEPLSADFTPEWLGDRLKGKATSIKAALVDQRLIAGHRQHLCLRGAFSRRHLAAPPCRHARDQDRQAHEGDRRSGQGGQVRARRGDQGRRLVVARLQARRRQARALSAFLQSVRSGGKALSQERLPRHRPPHRPERPLNLLLSKLSTVREQDAPCLPMN